MNMGSILNKELKLALHPTCFIFMGLALMVLIPNYPFYVSFFYMALGIFFTCLGGRENHDILYTMLLPVRKRDVVRGRILTAVLLELIQFALAAGATVLRCSIMGAENQAGMDANTALFGLSFIMMGVFNYVFFTMYYKAPQKVGRSFAWGSVAIFVFMIVAEACVFTVPFFRDRMDTPDPQFIGEKLAVLAVGVALYVLLTAAATKKSEKLFEKLDL